MIDNDDMSDNPLYNTEQRRHGMATRARTREDTSGNIGSLGLGGGSLSTVVPGSQEAPRSLARSLDPSKPYNRVVSRLHVGTSTALPGVRYAARIICALSRRDRHDTAERAVTTAGKDETRAHGGQSWYSRQQMYTPWSDNLPYRCGQRYQHAGRQPMQT